MLTPCRICGRATSAPYCEAHKSEAHTKVQRLQNSSYEREVAAFYTSKPWRSVRLLQLRTNPLCALCGQPATIADHVVPIRQGGSRLNMENLQSLCDLCHDRKRAVESTGINSFVPVLPGKFYCPSVIMVWGPPGSGKTTHVRHHAALDDLIVDVDLIAAAMCGLPPHQTPWKITQAALAARDAVLRLLCMPDGEKVRRAWVVTASPLHEVRNALLAAGATEYACMATRAQCFDRVRADKTRRDSYVAWHGIINRWYNDYAADNDGAEYGG